MQFQENYTKWQYIVSSMHFQCPVVSTPTYGFKKTPFFCVWHLRGISCHYIFKESLLLFLCIALQHNCQILQFNRQQHILFDFLYCSVSRLVGCSWNFYTSLYLFTWMQPSKSFYWSTCPELQTFWAMLPMFPLS